MTSKDLTERVAEAIWEELLPEMPRFKDLDKGYELYSRFMDAAEAAITTIKEHDNVN